MSQGNVSDDQLMARFYDGDSRAFDEVVRRWWPRVFAYFRRCGWSEADTAELTQEVFLRLFLTRDHIGGGYDPS
jgi:DNA-directed RNA polymerase specialized sigma24 family protein